MIVRPAGIVDAVHILDNLSEQHAAEHEALGYDRASAREMVQNFLAEGSAEAGCVDSTSEPLCMFGVTEQGNLRGTWFIATKAYFELGSAAVRHARGYMKRARAKYGPLTSVSLSPHPDVDRWMRLLGYEKLAEYDGQKIFYYR